MKRQQLISPGSLSRLLRAASESWKRRDYRQCVEILGRANRLDPANAGVLFSLGSAHGMCYDYIAAERCFARAVGVAPQKSDALTTAGLHCRDLGRYETAGFYFERAVEQKDATPDTFAKLAELYERLRRLEDAASMVDRALHLDGACALALLVRARLERLAGRWDEAERVVRSFLTKPDPQTWSTRIRGWYELGAVLDRQGRYDEAMAAFLQAKTLVRPNAVPYVAAQQLFRARVKEAAAEVSAERLQRWFAAGKSFEPQRRLAWLCGHPRSGTTLLEQVLDSHPDIVAAEETNIFRDDAFRPISAGFPRTAAMLSDLESAPLNALRQSRETYFRCMEMFLGKPMGDRWLVDKNPSLTAMIPAAIRIFPEIKFLAALRDPRDVCLSCFMQPLPLSPVSSAYLTLESTVEEYAAVMAMWKASASQMRNPYLEVRYEELVDDLESVSRRVLEFLRVPWNADVLRFDEHARQKPVRSPTYADVAKPVFKRAVGRWRNYQKHLEPHLEKLAPFVKAFGYD